MIDQHSTSRHLRSHEERQDFSFLAFITIVSSLHYLSRLGFYSDDWSFLRLFHFSNDQSVVGLARSFILEQPDILARPVQVIYAAALYRAFGHNPLGYHLVNTAVFLVGLCFFSRVLRVITGNRLITLAVVLVYSQLPHYSTDRFWSASFQANLSMALYFMCFFADIRSIAASDRLTFWIWTIAASLCLMLSALAYEVFLPLFLLNPFLVAIAMRRRQDSVTPILGSHRTLLLQVVRNAVIVAAIVVFKSTVSSRSSGFGLGWWLVRDALAASVNLSFGAYGLHLPHILWTISTNYWSWATVLITLMLVVSISLYLVRTSRRSKAGLPSASTLALIIPFGMAVCGLAYSNFYAYYKVTTGINNRVSIAAALAVSFSVVALAGLLSRVFYRRPGTNYVFCVAIALVCGCGYLIDDTIASFWTEAANRQRYILSQISQHFTAPPTGSSVMLTGFCPWTGPGIVFETDWDVTGALALLWHDNTVQGDVLRPWMKVTEHSISVVNGKTYSFESLYVYDVQRRVVRQITDQKVATQTLAESAQDDTGKCRADYESFGRGQLIW
jgi:hypothetical protein